MFSRWCSSIFKSVRRDLIPSCSNRFLLYLHRSSLNSFLLRNVCPSSGLFASVWESFRGSELSMTGLFPPVNLPNSPQGMNIGLDSLTHLLQPDGMIWSSARAIACDFPLPPQPAPKYHTKGCSRSFVDSREREHWFFLQHLSHFLAANFGRQ